MKTSTALVIANTQRHKNRLVKQLNATGLFARIQPLGSTSALFRHLQAEGADMVCWAMEKKTDRGKWIQRLQSNETWHDLPLIAFAEDRQSLLDGFEMGASDAVSMEIDPRELSARMHRHLQRWQRLLELRKSQEQLQKMALTDPLTGLGNRATFDLSIKQAVARAQRSGIPCSLLLVDLDHFKTINDTLGHPAGDRILQQVAAAIEASSRNADICCRYGGEEFAVILPDTKARSAEILAQRIHRQIARISTMEPAGHPSITVSIGISSATRRDNGQAQQLIEAADQALYLAKENGRNRTEIWRADVLFPQAAFSYQQPPQLAFGT